MARKFCPPAVTTEIAERLEVAEEKVSGKPPTAGSYSPYVPPRGGSPGMMSARTAQTTILRSSTNQGMVMAEGNFRAVDKTYWQFSCTIDVAAEEPIVTRVVVSPMEPSTPNPYGEGSGVTG